MVGTHSAIDISFHVKTCEIVPNSLTPAVSVQLVFYGYINLPFLFVPKVLIFIELNYYPLIT